MRKKFLPILVIIVVATVAFGVFALQIRNSMDIDQTVADADGSENLMTDEKRNEEGILIVSIDSNPEFFENAVSQTYEETEIKTTYYENTFIMSEGIELKINSETVQDKRISEPYILIVPDEVNGEKVVYFRIEEDDYVKEIQLPSGCQDISIAHCSTIEKVVCSASIYVTNISGCSELEEIAFPDECYYPEISGTFISLTSLVEINFPSSVEYVGYSFLSSDMLTDVKLNDGLRVICRSFQGCHVLESIDIPSSVTTIKECSFLNCEVLKEITLHDGLETISDSFTNCPALETLDIPDSVTLIDGESFTGCDNLTLIVGHDTAAEEYAIENDIPYQYRDEWS